MIVFLPAVGILTGAFFLLWHFLCVRASIPAVLFSAVSAVLPVLLTGGIHMDGFMDTWDAIGSHQTRERKLEIMKDSHAGAFAVMSAVICLLLLYALYDAACTVSVSSFPAVTAALGFVLSRALSGAGTILLPNARGTGMLAHLQEGRGGKRMLPVLFGTAAVCVLFMILASLWSGIFASVLAVGWFLFYCRFAVKTFGGATGDTTGFCIVMTEFMILLGAVIGGLVH
jgi:adenosylcobinamide-GDP ribazoletransferase